MLNLPKKLSCLVLIAFCSYTSQAQQIIVRFSETADDPLGKTLSEHFVPTTYTDKAAPTIKLPNRRHSARIFVNEFIPFKNGYIINSLTTSPSAGSIEIKYDFFFLNLADNSLSQIEFDEMDTIHSIITNEGVMYVSGVKGNQLKVVAYAGKEIKELTFGADILAQLQPQNNWLKLGIYNNGLIALCKNGVLNYSDGKWQKLIDNSIDAYYLQKGYKRSHAIIPTENIRIYKNKLYFLQEVVQQRSADLFTLNLEASQSMTEFFSRHGLSDNTKKEIDSYLPGSDGKLYVAINRLMRNQIVLCESGDTVSTIILNDQLKNKSNGNTPINASCIIRQNDRKILIGSNGLFEIKDNTVTPLLFLDNTVQQIRDGGFTFNEEFKPRSAVFLGPSKYLIGGLWGGIYIVDLDDKKIQCLDDLKKQPATVNFSK